MKLWRPNPAAVESLTERLHPLCHDSDLGVLEFGVEDRWEGGMGSSGKIGAFALVDGGMITRSHKMLSGKCEVEFLRR